MKRHLYHFVFVCMLALWMGHGQSNGQSPNSEDRGSRSQESRPEPLSQAPAANASKTPPATTSKTPPATASASIMAAAASPNASKTPPATTSKTPPATASVSIMAAAASPNAFSPSTTNFLPPPPTASQILRFADYPVSHYTGLVDISVPIHTIEVNGMTVPITLRYHASGLKYDDISTGAGLGWMLEAGGSMVYQLHGAPTDQTQYVFNKLKNDVVVGEVQGGYWRPTDLNQLLNMSWEYPYSDNASGGYGNRPAVDGEVDIITYSLPGGQSGKAGTRADTGLFFFDRDTPISISGTTLTDENGIEYAFGTFESYNDADLWYNKTQTRLLTKMTSTDKKDVITLNYAAPADRFVKPHISEHVTAYNRHMTPAGSQAGIGIEGSAPSIGGITFQPKLVETITYRGGKVVFEWSGLEFESTPIKLDAIRVYTGREGSYTLLKTATLVKGTFENGEEKLLRVEFRNGSSSAVESDYEFEYEPRTQNMLAYDVPGVDWWGYYTGTSGRSSFIPQFYWNGSSSPNSRSREPNAAAMISGMLKKVKYPTGGYSTFEYEPHRTNYPNKTWGGLRIKQISHYDNTGTNLLYRNRYAYGAMENGFGQAVGPYPDYSDWYRSTSYYLDGWYDYPFPEFYQSYILESQYDVYTAFAKNLQFSHGSPVVYTSVTEYREDSVNPADNGKTVYSYSYHPSTGADTNTTNLTKVTGIPLRTYDYKNGKLNGKRIYDSGGRELYSLVNEYEVLYEGEHRNLNVVKTLKGFDFDWGYPYYGSIYDPQDYEDYIVFHSQTGLLQMCGESGLFEYYNYYSVFGRYALTSTTETKDGVRTVTAYTYPETLPGQHWPYPSKAITTHSDNSVLRTEYSYATGLYPALLSKHFGVPVAEQTEYSGTSTTPLSRTIVNYNSSTHPKHPSSIQTLGNTSSQTATRVEYTRRNTYGNPEYVVEDGIRSVYIRSYTGQYPVIEIRGVTDAEANVIFGESAYVSLRDNAAPTESAITSYATTLRNRLPGALVTAYTHKPGVGMLSTVDPSGRTTYYEYDTQNRLSLVRDSNRNVVEQYKYNYKN